MRININKAKNVLVILITSLVIFSLAACGNTEKANEEMEKETLVFADASFDSLLYHNQIARIILEEGYGYKTDVIPGSTPATLQGLESGDIDIYMEIWKDNYEDTYQKMLDSGKVFDVGSIYDDNAQGIYVPTYIINGDPERGIEPITPDLETVKDLEKYAHIFKDPEDPEKGRIISGIPGWAADEIISTKIESYGLDKTYNIFRPGSGAALATSIVKAYEAGEPWVGYYWEPTWIMGKYDMTLLKEAEFNEAEWNNGYKTAFPSVNVTIGVNTEVKEKAPEVVEFLEKFQSSNDLANAALSYMQENDAKPRDAAIFYLKEHEDLWTKWVPKDVAEKVKASIQ